MSEQTEAQQAESFPAVVVRKSSFWQRLPIVWLVPIIAGLAGGWLAY